MLLSGIQALAQRSVAIRSVKESKAILWTADWHSSKNWIATGGDDSLIRIYDATNLKLVNAFRVNGMIRRLAWHPHTSRLAIATHNDALSILDVTTGRSVPLKDITSGARAVGWNYNGDLLATADNDGLVRIWNARGVLLRTIRKKDDNSYFSLHWHPTLNMLAVSGDDIRLMDTSGNTLKVIQHRKEQTGVLAVRWHPSGRFFVTGDYGHEEEGVKSILQFWKPDGTLIRIISDSKAEYRNIEWSPDGRYLATASDALRIRDENGNLLATGKSAALLWGISWNSKGDTIVTTGINGSIAFWTKQAALIERIR